jgi:hypothetical protein
MRSREEIYSNVVSELKQRHAEGIDIRIAAILEVLLDLRDQNEKIIDQNERIIKALEDMLPDQGEATEQ